MKIFWVNLEINFFSEIPLLNDKNEELPEGVSGFFQEIGCTADNENELKRIINDNLCKLYWIDISKRHVNFDRIGEISQEEIASEIYSDPDIKESLIADPKKKGIWYKSGIAFFSDSDENDEIFEVKLCKVDTDHKSN